MNYYAWKILVGYVWRSNCFLCFDVHKPNGKNPYDNLSFFTQTMLGNARYMTSIIGCLFTRQYFSKQHPACTAIHVNNTVPSPFKIQVAKPKMISNTNKPIASYH